MNKLILIFFVSVFTCNVFAQTGEYKSITLNNSGDGALLLNLNTERPWKFKQVGSGAYTNLQLHNYSGPNKHFQIKTNGGFQLLNQSDNPNSYLSANGGNSYIGYLGGNLGIGTNTPSSQLHIYGTSQKLLKLENTLDYDAGIEFKSNLANFKIGAGIGSASNSFVIYDLAAGKSRLFINSNGNIGIGANSTNSKVEIVNKGEGAELLKLTTERPWVFRQINTGSTSQLDLHSTVSDKNFKITSLNNNRVAQFFVSDVAASNKVFLVPDGGNVGIGTTTTGSHKLAVDGSIGAREIQVESSDWSDFVFEDNYELKSINELESYIEKNKRLPDIPSASEVEKDGIKIGEMNAKLLQKVEELTLYLIEQNKMIKAQQKEIEELKSRL
jgi:hypothetical protein